MQAVTESSPRKTALNPVLWRWLSTERTRLRLEGADARRFLHGMVSNDIQALTVGKGCHAALLTIKGKLLGDLVVYDCGDCGDGGDGGNRGLLIELQASAGSAVHSALDRHLIMDRATLHDDSQLLGELGVYGAGAAAALATAVGFASGSELGALPRYHFRLRPDAAPLELVAASSELGLPGFHVIAAPATLEAIVTSLAAQGASELSAADAEILRVEAGTPYYGRDLDEDRMPSEAGLDDAVSFSKGCYLGQEVVVRLRDRGHLNRRLTGLILEGSAPPPPAGTKLRHAERPSAGTITSAVASPRLGTIALAYVHRTAWEPGTTLELLSADEQPLGRTATVVALPFAPHSP